MAKDKKNKAALTEAEIAALLNQVNEVSVKKEEPTEEVPKLLSSAFGIAKNTNGKYEIYEIKFHAGSGYVQFVGKATTSKKVLTSHSMGSILIPSVNVLLETRMKEVKK